MQFHMQFFGCTIHYVICQNYTKSTCLEVRSSNPTPLFMVVLVRHLCTNCCIFTLYSNSSYSLLFSFFNFFTLKFTLNINLDFARASQKLFSYSNSRKNTICKLQVCTIITKNNTVNAKWLLL
jgi:hypothetical protein